MLKTYTINTNEKAPKRLILGRRAEDGATVYIFNIAPLIAAYGVGTAILKHRRSEDELPYFPAIKTTGEAVEWVVSDADTAYEGYGEAELDYYTNSGLTKSVIYTTLTLPAISEDTSEETKTALDLLTDAVNKVIEGGGVSPEKLAEAIADYFEEHPLPEGVTYTLSIDNGVVSLTGSDGSISSVVLPLPDLTNYVTKDYLASLGYLTQEADPSVPAWAKAATKPAYTAAEVGALPEGTYIPNKVSDLENDEHFVKVDALSEYVLVEAFDEWGQRVTGRLSTAENTITAHETRLDDLEDELAGVDALLQAI